MTLSIKINKTDKKNHEYLKKEKLIIKLDIKWLNEKMFKDSKLIQKECQSINEIFNEMCYVWCR